MEVIIGENSILSIIRDRESDCTFTNQEKFILATGNKIFLLKELICSKMGKALKALPKMESKVLEHIIMLMETSIKVTGKTI